ncbi:MAG TPA: IS5 family transposase [Pseudoxanthomonas sp.]|nr:IS5 family transposase [Pseudoxanthomonas sp.]
MLKISDAHWDRIKHHFPEENIPEGRARRKPVPTRQVLDAVLWILNTGAQWKMLPQSYPNYKTVHRRFRMWAQQEILRAIPADLANELREHDLLDTSECYVDATFANGRGGGLEIGTTKCGKGVKIMAIVDRAGLPLSVSTHAANHHEVKLVQLSLDFYMIEAMPEIVIGDRAYDSDDLDDDLDGKGIRMVSPHRRNRKKPRTQDGRELRRYERRWIVERFFAWMKHKRRLLNEPLEVSSTELSGICAGFCSSPVAQAILR